MSLISNFGSVSRVGSLYVVGNSALLSSKCVSVAGTRQIDSASSKWLKNIISQFNKSTIVSGLALGTDTIAHQTALENNLPTIAVLPSGFNSITPKANISLAKDIVQSGGLLISAYSPDTKVQNSYYIARNKIIADLGSMLIVPQFNIRSGTRHTVDFIKNLHKPIIVQNGNYSGNSFIIKDSNYLTIPK